MVAPHESKVSLIHCCCDLERDAVLGLCDCAREGWPRPDLRSLDGPSRPPLRLLCTPFYSFSSIIFHSTSSLQLSKRYRGPIIQAAVIHSLSRLFLKFVTWILLLKPSRGGNPSAGTNSRALTFSAIPPLFSRVRLPSSLMSHFLATYSFFNIDSVDKSWSASRWRDKEVPMFDDLSQSKHLYFGRERLLRDIWHLSLLIPRRIYAFI